MNLGDNITEIFCVNRTVKRSVDSRVREVKSRQFISENRTQTVTGRAVGPDTKENEGVPGRAMFLQKSEKFIRKFI